MKRVHEARMIERSSLARRSSVAAWMSLAMGMSFDACAAEYDAIRTPLELGQCATAGDAVNRGLARDEAAAFYYAGFLYEYTSCVTEDLPRAARYYLQGAKLGDTRAADAMGRLYGRGQGVTQDYVAAYDWYIVRQNRGAPAAAVDQSMALLMGYAMTVAHLARDKAVYPRDAERAELQSGMEAVFDAATGLLQVRYAKVDTQIGTRVARKLVFIDAVIAAYRDAVAEVPVPSGFPQTSLQFVTPWRFGWMRDDVDGFQVVPGYITIGDTDLLVAE